MRALSTLGGEEARRLRGLLFDLDDTLLSHGVLTRAAYDALWNLRDAGLALVAVTGRPSGWGELLVRQWPIDGCVTENGAVHVRARGARHRPARRLRRGAAPGAERAPRAARRAGPRGGPRGAAQRRRARPDQRRHVGRRRARDAAAGSRTPHRARDRARRGALDAVQRPPARDVRRRRQGDRRDPLLRAASSEKTRASPCVRYAFAGDSGNDAACFAAFRTTFGVANVRASLGRLSVTPRYVATREMGEGFAEIAAAILSARAGPSRAS